MPPSEWTNTPSHSHASPSTKSVKAKYYDIVAIGLQECNHKDEWVESLQNYYETIRRAMSLPKQTHEMVVLGTSTQWGITLIVFVRKGLKSRITSLCIDQVAAGGRKIVGVAVANKGAVMISFSLNGSTSLCFVCSHFPARAERLAKRNKTYGTIVDDLHTKPKIRKSEMDRDISSKSQTSVSIFSCDHVFWVGDFNYRVDGGRGGTPEEFNQVVSLSKHMNFQKIVKFDQLLREIRNGRSFVGFREGTFFKECCFRQRISHVSHERIYHTYHTREYITRITRERISHTYHTRENITHVSHSIYASLTHPPSKQVRSRSHRPIEEIASNRESSVTNEIKIHPILIVYFGDLYRLV